MDLADVGGNVKDGCHIAALGGSWMAAVHGLAGMRDQGGRLSFNPRPYVERLRFALTVRGQRLEVYIENGFVTYRLRGKAGLTITHCGETLALRDGEAVTRNLAESAETSDDTHDRDRSVAPPRIPSGNRGDPADRTANSPARHHGRPSGEGTR